MPQTEIIVFSGWFYFALAMCCVAVILDKNMDKYTKRAFLEHPNHPQMGYVCQLLFLTGITAFAAMSVIDQSLSLFLTRLIIFGVVLSLIGALTSFTLMCYQLHYRWHIFGR